MTSNTKQAAFFNVGDLILFGKYKNKKGKIVGFSVSEKGDPQVEIEPVPKGKKQNKTMNLFKIRKAPKTAAVVATRYMVAHRYAAQMVTRQQGTCAVCWRIQKIPNGLLANHGYNRPGSGYIEGECPGSRHAPWEVSKETGEMALSYYQTRLSHVETETKNLPTAETFIEPGGTWTKPKVHKKSETDPYLWKSLIDNRLKKLAREKEDLSKLVGEYTSALASWKVAPVIEIDEAKIERQREEKRQEVRNTRLERYKALSEKARDRATRTWNNLKQRESKAKSKPTDKNFLAVVTAAHTLYTIYTDVSYKLAEAHPDREYTPLQAIEDLDMAATWKHLGLLKGSTYMDRKQARDTYERPIDSMKHSLKYGWDGAEDWRPNWPGWK